MWLSTLFAVLLLAPDADEQHLIARLKELNEIYAEHASHQTPAGARARASVVREIAHLPFEGEARTAAARLLARIVTDDRSFPVRAAAARALGRVGTRAGMQAMYRSLFGDEGRSRRYALLHAVLPEALENVRHPDDVEWLREQVLEPARRRVQAPVLLLAGPLRETLVVLTLDGVGRAGLSILQPQVVGLAESGSPAVRRAALGALVEFEVHAPVIDRALADPDPLLREAAARFPVLNEDQVRLALEDPSERVRRAAIRRLETRPPTEAPPLLIDRLQQEERSDLRLDLAETLHKLTGKEFGTDYDLWRSWWVANKDRFEGPVDPDPAARIYFFRVGLRTQRVTFLIDASASMEREDRQGVSRQVRAHQELSRTLNTLPKGTQFRLVAFSSDVRSYPDFDRPGADRTRFAEGLEWLAGIRSAGATNTYGALMRALEDDHPPDTIVLLSDGNPYRCSYKGKNYSEHEQILAEVRMANARKQIRIHTVALLTGAPHAGDDEDAASAVEFLSRLAAQNRGQFTEIR